MLKFALNFYSKTLFVGTLKESILPQNKVQNIFCSPCFIKRYTSFFTKSNINELWKSVTCVSNAGKRRGRGKGNDRKARVNLFKNKLEGHGEANIYWPGLTGPVTESQTLVHIHKQLGKRETIVDTQSRKKFLFRKVHPLSRGWSGKKIEGRILSPPEDKFGLSFTNFQSILISKAIVGKMTGNLGKKKGFKVIVLVGNQKGLIGMGKGEATSFQAALRKGKDKAIKELISVDLTDKHTVNHDFYSEYGYSRLYVFRKPEGYGLKCHRVLQACCYLLGIKDLLVKIEGASFNTLNVVKAFLIGLLYKQKTFQQIADETKLHVVQFKKENLNYPKVLASPKDFVKSLNTSEKPIFYHYIMDNNIFFRKNEKEINMKKYPKSHYRRNHKQVQTEILIEYGKYKSFLADRYPECQLQPRRSKIK